MILRKVLAIAFCTCLAFAGGCAQEEEPGEQIREELEDVGEEMEDVADEVSDQVEDTVDEIEEDVEGGN